MKTSLKSNTICILWLLLASHLNAQNWEWAKQITGKNSFFNISKTTAIKKSVSGDIYLAGHFNDTALFGSNEYISDGVIAGFTTSDGFVAKLNSSGDLIWLKQFKCKTISEINDIAIDASGNLYALGSFTGTLTVDTSNFQGANNNSTLMLGKFDPNGKMLWMKTALNGTGGTSRGLAISIGTRDVIIVGNLEKKVSIESVNLDAKGDFKFLLARFDQDGNFIWAKTTGETNPINPKLAMVSDTKGNFYLTGSISDINTMDTIPFNALTGGSFFVAAFDSTGGIKWFKQSESASTLDFGGGIALGNHNMIYVTGAFAADVFTVGNISVNRSASLGGRDFFVLKMNTSGQTIWIKQSHGTAPDTRGMGIIANSDSSIFVTGRFGSPVSGGSASLDVTFGEGTDAKLLKNGGLLDVFVAKYNQNGNLIWVDKASGIEAHECFAITGDGLNSAFVTGIFKEDISFGSINLKTTPDGGVNPFYAKINGSINAIVGENDSKPEIHPLPAHDILTINAPENTSKMEVWLYNLYGELLLMQSTPSSLMELPVSNLLPGMYVLKVRYNNKVFSSKVVFD